MVGVGAGGGLATQTMDNLTPEKLEGWTPGNGNGLSSDVNQRFSTAIMNFNAELAGCRTGALVQVWMPETSRDGSVVLQTRGLPFSISGVGDLLALFRCVSCRYRFTTDASKPHLMGVIGRVYSSGQPELCYDVQRYDRSVYLRASEAQRCRVHSTMVTPVYLSAERERAVSVVEVSHHDKDVKFSEIIKRLSSCLESLELYMAEIDGNNVPIGLRNWAVNVGQMASETVVKAESEFGGEGDGAAVGFEATVWAAAEGVQQETAGMDGHAGAQLSWTTQSRSMPPLGLSSLPYVSPGQTIRIPTRGGFVSRSASGPIPRPILPPRSGYVGRSRSGPLTRASSLQGVPCSGQGVPNVEWAPGTGGSQGDFSMCQVAVPQPASLPPICRGVDPGPTSTGGEALNSPAAVSSPLPSIDVPPQPELYSSSSDFSEDDEGKDANEDKNVGSQSRDAKLDADADDRQLEKPGSGQGTKNDNRLGGGAGKRLTFKDLQGCFGVGLKEAAGQLGICPTTLKRACRRNGISRWPSRQISKLSKAWHQMGYQGSPPSWLVRKAITGNLKCDNLVFSLNAGLHLGLMQAGGAQPPPAAQAPQTWSVVNRQHTVPVPTATVLPGEADVQLGQQTCQMGPSSCQLPSLSTDQSDFYDEMAGILQEPTSTATWQLPRPAPGSLQGLNPQNKAHRVFRSNSAYGTHALQAGSPDFAIGGGDVRQDQGKEQLIPVPVLTAFDGLGDSFAADVGFANALSRATMENATFGGMEGTAGVNEIGIAGGLF